MSCARIACVGATVTAIPAPPERGHLPTVVARFPPGGLGASMYDAPKLFCRRSPGCLKARVCLASSCRYSCTSFRLLHSQRVLCISAECAGMIASTLQLVAYSNINSAAEVPTPRTQIAPPSNPSNVLFFVVVGVATCLMLHRLQ